MTATLEAPAEALALEGRALASMSCGKTVFLVAMIGGQALDSDKFLDVALNWQPTILKAEFLAVRAPQDGQWFDLAGRCRGTQGRDPPLRRGVECLSRRHSGEAAPAADQSRSRRLRRRRLNGARSGPAAREATRRDRQLLPAPSKARRRSAPKSPPSRPSSSSMAMPMKPCPIARSPRRKSC